MDFIRELANGDKEIAIQTWKKIRDFKNYKEKHKEFLNNNQDYEKKELESFSKVLQQITAALILAVEQGNKHRKVYLEEIRSDINNSPELKALLQTAKKSITPEEFFHILGHVSNIQLRGLRKYFNDPKMANGNDYWDPERLKKYYARYLKAWHAKSEEERTNRNSLLKQLENENKSILDLFTGNPPSVSIPPYEDQNNRHIPTCQNLLLSAKKLDKEFLGWREIVKKLGYANSSSNSDSCENVSKTIDFYDSESIKDIIKELTKSLQGHDKDTSKIPFEEDSILLQRILETIVTRIAKEVAILKIQQLEECITKEIRSLEIPVLMEENQFSFTEEALNLKKSGEKAKEKNKNKKDKFEGKLKTKSERIKTDSENICAYTGKSIGNSGEIDHIIPRSSTRDRLGSVYNSELNLLYVSREGNQNKGNREFTLNDVHDSFLMKHFGTNDRNGVRSQIREILEKIKTENKKERRNYIIPDKLDALDRIAIKLALFDSELRNTVLPFLSMHSKTLVNGTQAWFFKKLRKELTTKIKKEFPNINDLKITSHFFSTKDENFALRALRDKLAELNVAYKKEEKQKESSHIIDATIVFAQGLIQSRLPNKYDFRTPHIPEDETQVTGEWLESLLPRELEMNKIKRKNIERKNSSESLFNSRMYAERFLNVLIDKMGMKFGFIHSDEFSSGYIPSKDEDLVFTALKDFLLLKGNKIEISLPDLKEFALNENLLLRIHRKNARNYLQNLQKETATSKVLENLRYATLKKEINIEKNQIKPPKGWDSKIKFEVPLSKKFSFRLTMPYTKDWEKLLVLNQTKSDNIEVEVRNYFLDSNSHKEKEETFRFEREHKRVRRRFSLPYKPTFPGTIFRVRRWFNGEEVFQLHASNGSNIKGYPILNGEVQFSKPVLRPSYVQEGSLSTYYLSEKNIVTDQEEIVSTNEWREIKIPNSEDAGIQKVSVAPLIKGGAYVRLILQTNIFLRKLGLENNKESLYSIDLEQSFSFLDESNLEPFAQFVFSFSNKILMPSVTEKDKGKKGKFLIERINYDSTQLYYESGFPSSLKSLYNQGMKVESP